MRRRTPFPMIVLALVAALGMLAVAGCGDDAQQAASVAESVATQATEAAPGGDDTAGTAGSAPAPGGGGTVEITADESGALAFQEDTVSAPAGRITLRMTNPAPVGHNIAVDEPAPMEGEVVEQGGVSEVTADFPAGEYEYYCSVPGHREAGMVGTLVAR